MIAHRHLAFALLGAALFACGGGELEGGARVVPSGASPGGAGGAKSATGGGATTTGAGAAAEAGAAGTNGAGAPSAGGTTAAAGSGGAAGGDCGGAFLAFASDFSTFETWPSFYLGDIEPTPNEISGPRTVYINKLPPHGSTEFPVGTMIVKAIKSGNDPALWQIFAMAKRGACFNALGAHGWEWFELTLESGPLDVVWRGVAPASGAGYGGGKFGGLCNGCHDAFSDNDYVQGPFLQLSAF